MSQTTEDSFAFVTILSNLHDLQSFLQGLEPCLGVAYLLVNESLSPAQDAMQKLSNADGCPAWTSDDLPAGLLKSVYAFVIMPDVCMNYKIG